VRVPPPSLPESTTRMTELFSSRPRRHGRPGRRTDEFSGTRVRTRQGRACTRLIVLVTLVVLPSLVRSQESFPLQQSPIDDYTIRVTVDEVVLHATAQNHKGTLISGLGKEDFRVYEDGVPQEIKHFSHEDIPVTVGLVVDNSGSMRPKRADVIAAALAFVRSSNPMDQMFVVTFNEKVSFGLPGDMPFTDDVVKLGTALSRISANGETALYDAVAAALEHLKKGGRDKKVLIVISDGGDNASRHNLAQIRTIAGHPDAIIYTIGIFDEQDSDQNPHVLKQLAKDTGGEAFLPESLKEVLPICERIARDVRNQYTIAYIPSNRKPDGTYRNILVRASAPGRGHLVIRTRAGYFAPSVLPSASPKATDHDAHN
jgi:Ca-activated chloride channel family protein